MLSYEEFMAGYDDYKRSARGNSGAAAKSAGKMSYEDFMEGFYTQHPDKRPRVEEDVHGQTVTPENSGMKPRYAEGQDEKMQQTRGPLQTEKVKLDKPAEVEKKRIPLTLASNPLSGLVVKGALRAYAHGAKDEKQDIPRQLTMEQAVERDDLSATEKQDLWKQVNYWKEANRLTYDAAKKGGDGLTAEQMQQAQTVLAAEKKLGGMYSVKQRAGRAVDSMLAPYVAAPEILLKTTIAGLKEKTRQEEAVRKVMMEEAEAEQNHPGGILSKDNEQLRRKLKAAMDENKEKVEYSPQAKAIMHGAGNLTEESSMGLSKGQKLGHEVAYSVGDNLMRMPLELLAPGAGLALTGAKTAAQGMLEKAEDGKSAREAMERGTLAGGIEATAEKIGMDNLLAAAGKGGKRVLSKTLGREIAEKGGKKLAQDVLTGAAAEGLEEGVGYLANYAVDKAYQDPQARFDVGELGSNMLLGGLSGLVLGGAGSATGAIGAAREKRAKSVQSRVQEKTELDMNNVDLAANENAAMQDTETPVNAIQNKSNSKLDDMLQKTAQTTGVEPVSVYEVNRIANAVGRKVVFEDMQEGQSGYYQDGVIHISNQSKNPAMEVFVHELTHHLEAAGEYKNLAALVMDSQEMKKFLTQRGATLDDYRTYISQQYAARGVQLDTAGADAEIVARFCQDNLFKDEASVRRLCAEKPTLGQRILQFLRDTLARIGGQGREVQELRRAERMYTTALAQAGNGPMDGQARYQRDLGPEGNAAVSDAIHQKMSRVLEPEQILSESIIQMNRSKLTEMEPVAEITESKILSVRKNSKLLKDEITEYFRSIGGIAKNAVLGEVALNKGAVRDDLQHGYGKEKIASFEAIPQVIEHGLIVDYQFGWKGSRSYDTVTLAAPIVLEGKPYLQAVICMRDKNTQRFKIHEVVLEQRAKKEAPRELFASNAPVLSEGYAPAQGGLPASNILRRIQFVNTADTENMTPEQRRQYQMLKEDMSKNGLSEETDRLEREWMEKHPTDKKMLEPGQGFGQWLEGQGRSVGKADAAQQAPKFVPWWEQLTKARKTDALTHRIYADAMGLAAQEKMPNATKKSDTDQSRQTLWEEQQQKGPQGGPGGVPLRATAKSLEIQKRHTNLFVKKVGESFNVPVGAQREFLKPIAQELAEDIKTKGKVDVDTMNRLFEKTYEQGRVIESEYYDQYRDLKNELRTTALTLDAENSKSAQARELRAQYNRRHLLRITDNGIPVDAKYQELAERYPGLFPQDIVNPLDQMQHMGEIAKSIQKVELDLDAYYGEDAEDFKRYARYDFDRATEQLADDLVKVRRLEADTAYQETIQEEMIQQTKNETLPTVDEQLKAYETASKAQKKADRLMQKSALTDADKKILKRLLAGEVTPQQLMKEEVENLEEILPVYEARKAQQDAMAPVRRAQAARRAALAQEAESDLEGTENWTDKKKGIQYSTETMERNVLDISHGDAAGKAMAQKYFRSVHKNEAKATQFKNSWRNQIRILKLNDAESAYVQIDGEISYLENKKQSGHLSKMQEAQLAHLYKALDELMKGHEKEIDRKKMKPAEELFRKAYDAIFPKINQAYIENGYPPIGYQKGYFPHFTEHKPDTLLQRVAASMGVDMKADALPTDIVGLTHIFKPGRRWNPFAQTRTGFNTEYDALKGFDKYIEYAADAIYHTEDIQRLRALENGIRYKYSDKGVKAEMDKIRMDESIDPTERQELQARLREQYKGHMSGFVQEVAEYTNLLAGKKSLHDRTIEKDMGRSIYQTMNAMESRVAANMVAVNPGSWLTNFIPITQAGAECSTKNLLQAARDQAKAWFQDDGFAKDSVFLTNRAGSSALSLTKMQEISNFLSKPMEWIDGFTSGVVTRAKYLQNRENGMDSFQAMENADDFAAGLMADRSKGSMPTAFHRKNPLTRLFTMYQLEVNNQLRYLVKDLPRHLKQMYGHDEYARALAMALVKYTLGAYLYNDLYEMLTGRRSALDFLGIANDAMGDFAGIKLPNTVEEMGKIANGTAGLEDLKASPKNAGAALGNLGKNVAEEIPFIGGLLGGGRIPVSSAIPDIGRIATTTADLIAGEKTAHQAMGVLGKELAKPAYYLLPPVGGGQIKKAVEGLGTIAKGGSYKVDKDGQDQLQFAVENPGFSDIARATIFGKWSLPQAQEYIAGGNKPKSRAYTEAYKAGVSTNELDKLLPNAGKQPEYAQSIGGAQAQKVDYALNQLIEATGEKGVKQSLLPGTVTVDGEPVRLTGKQQVKMSRARNELSYALLLPVLDSDLDVDLKAEYAKSVQKYAGQVAQEEAIGKAPEQWVQKVRDSAGVKGYTATDQLANAMLARAIINTVEPTHDATGKSIAGSREKNALAALQEAGFTQQQAKEWWNKLK